MATTMEMAFVLQIHVVGSVILRLHEEGERIPLTIESSNAERGIRCRPFLR